MRSSSGNWQPCGHPYWLYEGRCVQISLFLRPAREACRSTRVANAPCSAYSSRKGLGMIRIGRYWLVCGIAFLYHR